MIGKKIFEIRKRRGYTLSELAERANVSKSYLSNIERNINQNPSIQVIKKIASVLDVDLRALLETESSIKEKELPDQELIDLVNELKESGIEKIEEFKTLIEFIKWQNLNIDAKK
ncbi:helix-turn-helix domain-containing protein [Neobacillus soli]|uniref:helix-turn-helix domain-containing protein n=1 Tax=Neobacillus soli TaxID=220688 RepID=UPI000825E9D7|nr:helix-turn-helix transcriptional regulator [Neobacillus soli]